MIHNTKLINALRSLNYTFKRQADRVCIYKQRGTTRRVAVRRHDWHDEEYVRTLLRSAGMPLDDVERFIIETRETKH
ncbi:MAG: hypothetical protein ACRD72_25845 [Candidatus Angelobacter sp.]